MIKSALNKTQPEEKPIDVKFEDIFNLACFHHVANMAYYSIERLKEPPSSILLSQWKEIRDKAIVRDVIQNNEKDKIIHTLSNASISVLPLKGSVLKKMYPSSDMRISADIDILIHKEDQEKVKNLMINLGYSVEHFNRGNHDVYHKPPIMNVEIHTSLFAESSPYYEYYNTIWKKVKSNKTDPFIFKMDWNDFYIYMIVHLAKHFYGSGTGIRSIVDIYIFLKSHKEHLNYQYLLVELKCLCLDIFCIKIENLAEDWFSNEKVQIGNLNIQNYILSSGTYGTTKNRIKNNLDELKLQKGNMKSAKISYILQRAFLIKDEMKYVYPILKRSMLFLPFCWMHRLIKAAILKQNKIKEEIKTLLSI